MRHYFFLHYGWFCQNLGKEAVWTFMHTTVSGAFVWHQMKKLHLFNKGSEKRWQNCIKHAQLNAVQSQFFHPSNQRTKFPTCLNCVINKISTYLIPVRPFFEQPTLVKWFLPVICQEICTLSRQWRCLESLIWDCK